jgi:hypothetical protein
MVVAMVPVAFAACGGRALEAEGAGPDAGPTGDSASCVTIDVSTYDRSCNQASDCVTITAGTICDGQCGCGGSTINADGMAEYSSAISSIRQGDCFCPNEPTPLCLDNRCTICTGAATDPPNCGAIGDDTAPPECVDVDLSTYDQSCRNDGDCIEVTTGEICTDTCACGGSAISASEQQRYANATAGITTEACPCVAGGGAPRCIAAHCAICPDPSDPNQPADCIGHDSGAN